MLGSLAMEEDLQAANAADSVLQAESVKTGVAACAMVQTLRQRRRRD